MGNAVKNATTAKTKKQVLGNNPIFNKILIAWLLLFVGFLLVLAISLKLGVRFNLSPSVARGIYIAQAIPIKRHAYISVCVPRTPIFNEALKRHYLQANLGCPHYASNMMKRIAAVHGDVVSINYTGVWVNGELEPQSTPIINFADINYHLPSFANYTLEQDDIVLMSDNQQYGFDSRYYGILKLSDFSSLEIVQPLLTFKGEFK